MAVYLQVASLAHMTGMVFPHLDTSVIGGLGLLFLGISFHSKKDWADYISFPGWVLISSYFFLGTEHYYEIKDWTLVFMSAAALPLGIAVGIWDIKNAYNGISEPTMLWFRGMIFWAGTPYFLVENIPLLNRGLVLFVAYQAVFFMKWSGAGDYSVGDVYVQNADGSSTIWSDWSGSHYWLNESLGDAGIYAEVVTGSGIPIVNIVLGCTALQSMIIFVGAIVALNIGWKRKMRGLAIAIPLIHLLNIFRNAGVIWLDQSYKSWEWLGLNMFDFAHLHAAKFGSLTIMFLLSLVLFEILPELHKNVLKLLDPIMKISKKNTR